MQQNITGDMRIHVRLVYSYIGMYLEDSYLRLAQYVNLRAPTPSLLHAQSLARANMFRAPPISAVSSHYKHFIPARHSINLRDHGHRHGDRS
jgi:hypothetical protein